MKKITLHYPEVVVTEDEIFTSRSQEPKIRRVESRGGDVLNYRVEEAKLDPDGNIIPRVKPPFYEPTGRTLEWSIKVGETLSFPEYVANYLVKIYPFLEVVDVPVSVEPGQPRREPEQEEKEAKSVTGTTVCKYCGMHFTTEKGLGLHLGHKHFDKIA